MTIGRNRQSTARQGKQQPVLGGAATLSLMCSFFCLMAPAALAAEKLFSGGGDGTSWTDADNWFPTGVPGSTDAVTLNDKNLAVSTSDTFAALSVTVGGKEVSDWTVNSFVYGTLAPAAATDPAILIRKDGAVTMKGAGTVILKGSFKNTEEGLGSEPSLMILLE